MYNAIFCFLGSSLKPMFPFLVMAIAAYVIVNQNITLILLVSKNNEFGDLNAIIMII